MIHDVLHLSYTVSDLDQSVAWYTGVLGFHLIHIQVGDNDYTRTLVGIPGAVIRAAQLRLPNVVPNLSSHHLELVQYLKEPGAEISLSVNNIGAAHIALVTTDIFGEYERVKSHGVPFRSSPVEITEGANRGGFACYLSDLDGFTIELLQPSPERCAQLGIGQ